VPPFLVALIYLQEAYEMKKFLIIFLVFLFVLGGSAKMYEVTHYSQSLEKNKTFRIILPESYDENICYPVLYLLHGASGNYTDWHKNGILEEAAKNYELIIVTPDGENSWYVDSPIKENSKYASYFLNDLIPYIDSNYNTIPTFRGRGLAGLSMGGHGAITLAIKNPEVFGAASATSGVLDLRPLPDVTGLKEIFGDIKTNEAVWEENSAVELVDNLKKSRRKPKLLFDIGMSDVFYKTNLEFHKRLSTKGIDHTFKVYPGNHDWMYWLKHLPEHLEFHATSLRKPLPKEVEEAN